MKKDQPIIILVDENMRQLLRLRSFYDHCSIGDLVREAISKHIQPVTKEEHDR
jgi:hypothetical protein